MDHNGAHADVSRLDSRMNSRMDSRMSSRMVRSSRMGDGAVDHRVQPW